MYRSDGLYPGSGYLYNWKCVNEQRAALCPYPWRVPTPFVDFVNLDIWLGGSGQNRYDEDWEWINENYIIRWGAVLGGDANGAGFVSRNYAAWYWTADACGSYGCSVSITRAGVLAPATSMNPMVGAQVRCVR
jgi:uncharacterized protein (TIGR02145 family)